MARRTAVCGRVEDVAAIEAAHPEVAAKRASHLVAGRTTAVGIQREDGRWFASVSPTRVTWAWSLAGAKLFVVGDPRVDDLVAKLRKRTTARFALANVAQVLGGPAVAAPPTDASLTAELVEAARGIDPRRGYSFTEVARFGQALDAYDAAHAPTVPADAPEPDVECSNCGARYWSADGHPTLALLRARSGPTTMEYVKSHSKDRGNERADELAGLARLRPPKIVTAHTLYTPEGVR
jgi:hypothetical protein